MQIIEEKKEKSSLGDSTHEKYPKTCPFRSKFGMCQKVIGNVCMSPNFLCSFIKNQIDNGAIDV